MPPENSLSRQEIRAKVLRAHLQYNHRDGSQGLICPGCRRLIKDGWDPHEWLVKRSAVPVAKQHLIMTPVNIIPVHPGCHSNSKELTRKCLPHLVPAIFSASRIGMWYESLWRFNALSVPPGMLIPPKDLPVAMRLRMFMKGCEVMGIEIDDWQMADDDWTDIRGTITSRWAGKTRNAPKVPKRWHGMSTQLLYQAMFTGYWMDYLEGIIG